MFELTDGHSKIPPKTRVIHFQLLYQSIELPMFFSSRNYGMYPISASFPASFLIQQNNHFFIAGAAGAWNIHVFFVWFRQARKYLLSSSERLASVRSVKLRSATLCTGVFLFYIKRHLMSGNEFACSLSSPRQNYTFNAFQYQPKWLHCKLLLFCYKDIMIGISGEIRILM